MPPSSEEPSPALDDAIRAAARREAGAGPRPADAPVTHVPLALRPERWWWPLAAAATIGAVAIGLLQLATPDHVGAPGGDSAVVSDMPAPPQIAQRKSEAVRDEASAAPRMQATEGAARENTAPSTGTPAPPELLSAARPRAGTDATTAPPPVAALRKDTPAPLVAEERRAVPSDARASAEAKRKADAEMPAPARVAEPFPADAAKRDASEAGAAPPAPPKTAATSEAGVVSGKFAEAPATTGRTERAPEPPRAAPPSAPAQPANVSGASAAGRHRCDTHAVVRTAAPGSGWRRDPGRCAGACPRRAERRREIRTACAGVRPREAAGRGLDRADQEAHRRRPRRRCGEGARRIPRRASRSRAPVAARSARLAPGHATR